VQTAVHEYAVTPEANIVAVQGPVILASGANVPRVLVRTLSILVRCIVVALKPDRNTAGHARVCACPLWGASAVVLTLVEMSISDLLNACRRVQMLLLQRRLWIPFLPISRAYKGEVAVCQSQCLRQRYRSVTRMRAHNSSQTSKS
jgi:hypothetical protein